MSPGLSSSPSQQARASSRMLMIRKIISDMDKEIIFVALAYLAVCVTGTAYFVIKDKIDKKKHNDNGNQA
jgi:hypothetical protein